MTPPFYLRTQGYGLFSYADQQSGTANLTPLTTAVVAIANNGNADIYTVSPNQLNISSAQNSLKEFLNPVLQRYGVQNADFITTPFDANAQGMDAVLDSILISVLSDGQTIEIKNPFTGDTIGTGTIANGSVNVSDPITTNEANALPQPVIHRKYFVYAEDNYDSPEVGPFMIDVVEGDNGQISVTITATEGDTGDLYLIYGSGTKNGNEISFTVSVIMCTNTDPNGTGTATFTGTIYSNGNITGTFTNTLLSDGDTCEESGSNTYEGTWRASDVTSATPVGVAGLYDVYATPYGGWPEQGPATLQVSHNGSSINVSITAIDGDTGQPFTRYGRGIVYGNYLIFRVPVIICNDTCINGTCPPAEYATFFGEYNSANNTITGVYGDGVPAGDYCRDPNNQNTKAIGTWRAVKK